MYISTACTGEVGRDGTYASLWMVVLNGLLTWCETLGNASSLAAFRLFLNGFKNDFEASAEHAGAVGREEASTWRAVRLSTQFCRLEFGTFQI
jgi:hypothetical protein